MLKALFEAVRANEPEQLEAELPQKPDPKWIHDLLEEADRNAVIEVARCHRELTSSREIMDFDCGCLYRLSAVLIRYLGVRATLNSRI